MLVRAFVAPVLTLLVGVTPAALPTSEAPAVPPPVVAPMPAERPAIEAEDARAERIAMLRPHWGGQTPKVLRDRRAMPAAGGVTGVFGEWRGRHSHPGLDLDGETGDPIWAAAAGTVVSAGPSPKGYSGYGTTVLIDHGAGVWTLYAHLSAVHVVAGQQVLAGHQIGAMGTTGNVTGSHLHFEVRLNGVTIDPWPWLAPARG